MSTSQLQQEALSRATGSQALSNLPTIYGEFIARGIAECEILPRVNVFTFHAWRALGRTVRRGEHGVHITTWVPMSRTSESGEKIAIGRRPKSAVVFHVSQTDALVQS